MRLRRHRRWMAPVAVAAAVGFALTGCTGDIANEDAADTDCADYEEYGTFDGAEVTVAGTILDLEADRLSESWADFETCTGISVDYQGSSEFEAQIAVLAEGGNAPDVGIVPQPGLLNRLADGGWLIPASQPVVDNIDEWWDPIWKEYATVDGEVYAAPLMASIKGYVWYSPAEFEENGYEIPATLDELTELSEQIAADSGRQPWCVGLESGDATGWPGTDWVEDYVLRLHGPEVYDQWVTHGIPFNDPQVAEAFDAVGAVPEERRDGQRRHRRRVDAGHRGLPDRLDCRSSTASARCTTRPRSTRPSGTPRAATPTRSPPTARSSRSCSRPKRPAAVCRSPAAASSRSRSATPKRSRRSAHYLSSDLWANNRVSLGGVISANKGLDPEVASSELLVQSIEILQNPETTFRFDGSDLMPGAVGADSFWKGIVAWVGGEDTAQVLDTIEASWPAS